MNIYLDLVLIVIVGLGLGGVLIWFQERRPRLVNLILGVASLTLAVTGFRSGNELFYGHHLFSLVVFVSLAAWFFYMAIRNREASTQN